LHAVAAYGLVDIPSMQGESTNCKLGGHFILKSRYRDFNINTDNPEMTTVN